MLIHGQVEAHSQRDSLPAILGRFWVIEPSLARFIATIYLTDDILSVSTFRSHPTTSLTKIYNIRSESRTMSNLKVREECSNLKAYCNARVIVYLWVPISCIWYLKTLNDFTYQSTRKNMYLLDPNPKRRRGSL